MSYKLIIRKLYLDEDKFIRSDLIRGYCKDLDMDYHSVIRYLTRNRYLIRIFRGIFYKLSIEERKLNKLDIGHLEVIRWSLKIKGIKNWYFGLETAVKLNNVTHEHFMIDYVMNDKIFRARSFYILGHKIKFVKLKKGLFKFGIKKKGLPFSDIEKTVLDMVYLSKYDGLSDDEIKNKIHDLLKHCSRKKLLTYARDYNMSVSKFVEGLT